MRYRSGAAGLTLVLTLAGCGGEDAGGGTVAPPLAVAPTPSPSPSATPPITLADHFTFYPFASTIRLRSFVPDGDSVRSRPVAVMLDLTDDRSRNELTWEPKGVTYTIRIGDARWTFGQEDRDPGDTSVERLRFSRKLPATAEGFGATSAFLSPAKTGAYIWVGSLGERSTLYRPDYNEEETRSFIVTGQPTAVERVPVSGSARASFGFAASMPVRYYLGFFNAESTADVDYTARTIRATFTAIEPSPPRGDAAPPLTLTLDARWEAGSAHITGSLRSDDGALAGTVAGRFYGPDAREWGMVLTMPSGEPLRGAAGYIVSAR